ncbi:putative NAD(P)/FAD-binding protein YdhS [Halopolyspora algeriensis]|uniref:Putative NAD(P)/FAD-binding protein YdhS n=1 Tax=Halopolyspora algeriensis TaxID=1500506 RepID=A0A368VAC7_9ACTN|nr:FAD/NAD(P)-binding protein [Halopolyspora algeriensis]RCW37663.1 putative NAD(P)/FAD-binding protein YdhS [Halopolyspora algeriensis]TQM53803.1 putative NAD(P)/FAD-binding protein YdhS [Halopolyspora algeriensis]
MDVGVIGGGASAVCLLDALAQSDGVSGSITIFEPGDELWRGRPFECDVDALRVNAPPDEMSVRFGDPEHFQRWLAARDLLVESADSDQDPFCGMRFVPRARFGEYLEQSAHAALLSLLEQGWQLDVVRDRVDSVLPDAHGLVLKTAGGRRLAVDSAVLCVGGGRPADSYALRGLPGYLPDPYPVSCNLDVVDADADVDVLGCGLTGVDVVLALAAGGHRARIRLLSRSGILPGVRQRPLAHELHHFTAERFRTVAARGGTLTVQSLIRIMQDELREVGEDLTQISAELVAMAAESPAERLRRNLAEVDSDSKALRIVQRAVPETGPDVWPLLPAAEKDELLGSHYREIMSLCCPMSPSSAATLLALIDRGQLEILSGIESIDPREGNGFVVTTAGGQHESDVMINGINPATNKISPKAESLIASLVAAQLAERHPRGGLHVERETSRLTLGGKPDPRLYALGDLAAGSLFFTFGIPSLVDRAQDIACALLSDVSMVRGDSALQTV